MCQCVSQEEGGAGILEKATFDNYCPMSNLTFLEKIIEILVRIYQQSTLEDLFL